MTQTEVEAFVAGLPGVQRADNYGYTFFFVGEDHRVPFTSIAGSDNEHDRVSNLDRAGVFRVNIGVSQASFDDLVGSIDSAGADHTALNTFLPHPHYARQRFICILNPSGENATTTQRMIREAHALATARTQRDSVIDSATVRIEPTLEAMAVGLGAAIDAVARERRYLAMLEGPPGDSARGFVRHLLGGGGVQMLALDGHDTVVGWCDILREEGEGFRHSGRLGMGVLPSHRRQGIGERLVRATVAAAWNEGLERIELEVFATNIGAIRLYEKCGFAHEGFKRHTRWLDGRYDDSVMMALLAGTQ